MNNIRMYGSHEMKGVLIHPRGFYGYNNGPAVHEHRPWWYKIVGFDPAWFDKENPHRTQNLEAYKLAQWLVQHAPRAGGYNAGSAHQTCIVGWQVVPKAFGESREVKTSWRYSTFSQYSSHPESAYHYWVAEARKMLKSGVTGCKLVAIEVGGQRYNVN